MWIDTHTHFDSHLFDEYREEIWEKALNHQIIAQFIMSTSIHHWDKVKQLAHHYSNSYYALGIHPFFISAMDKKENYPIIIEQLERNIQQALNQDIHFIGLGEIGLDKKNGSEDWQYQLSIFDAQLELAKRYQLPVFIHSLKSDHDIVASYCKKHQVSCGVIHAFNGSFEQAKRFIDMGFKLGFGGMITYPQSHKLRDLVAKLPLDAMVLETDSPHFPLSDSNHQQSYSYQLPMLAELLIQIKKKDQLTLTILANQLLSNVCDLFRDTALLNQYHLFSRLNQPS